MNTEVYVVMYSYYSDWVIYGYFTNREDADKYCVKHPEQELHVEVIPCYDTINDDFRHIQLKYCHNFCFYKQTGWESRYDGYSCYQGEFLKSNKIDAAMPNTWVRVLVNTTDGNVERAQKIATDILYQFLAMFADDPSFKNIELFNKMLSRDEDDRKEKEAAELKKQTEIAELKRLLDKYGNPD